MSTPLGRMVDIGGGRRLHYVPMGSGRPMVVFESGGAGGSSLQDLPVLRRIAGFTRGCIYDRAGLGWSDPAPPGRSFEARAADLHTLLTQTEAPPYILVGLSFGGLLARMFCRLYPQEVAGMVLVDAAEEEKYFCTMPAMRALLERQLEDEAAQAESGALRARFEKRLAAAPDFTAAEKVAMLEVVPRRSHYLTGLEELTAIDHTPPQMRRAGGFGDLGARPLIVLSHGVAYGGEMAPWEEGFTQSQQRLAALSSKNAHIVAKGVGHSIALEHPGLVAAAIAAVVDAARGGSFDVGDVQRLADGKA